MTHANKHIYQLKIALIGSKPPIWRRILLADSTPLPVFHTVLQIAMGWEEAHLHQFKMGNTFYGVPDPDFTFVDVRDEAEYKLNQLLRQEKDALIYEYDFGDSWEHKVTLEKILPFSEEAQLPRCIKAKGACPPEDVGGIWGYYEFLEAINDPTHPEHEGYLDWIGGGFDPDDCDIDEINHTLAHECR